jgi:superfamily II DNA helicase RecQ
MVCHPSRGGGLKPSPVFLCHPTGSGKSLMRDTFAIAQGGATWCISPLLSLAADQETKVNAGSNTTITAIHIDAYHSPAAQKLLRDHITSLSLSSPTTPIILSSPQAIVHNSIYRSMLHTLIRKRLLVLLVIDGIHLFVQFGLYFQSKFLQLRTLLFDRVRLSNHQTRMPVLFMTATATARSLDPSLATHHRGPLIRAF